MERGILQTLSYEVTVPTAHAFCEKILTESGSNDKTSSMAMVGFCLYFYFDCLYFIIILIYQELIITVCYHTTMTASLAHVGKFESGNVFQFYIKSLNCPRIRLFYNTFNRKTLV